MADPSIAQAGAGAHLWIKFILLGSDEGKYAPAWAMADPSIAQAGAGWGTPLLNMWCELLIAEKGIKRVNYPAEISLKKPLPWSVSIAS
jgi:hypothetical protein